MPNDPISKERYKTCLRLIRSSANNFSRKFRSNHVDYWDFFSEGILTLTLCLRKWDQKGNDLESSEFEHYFKQALSNNNKELLGKVFAQKRRGYFKPKDKPCFGSFSNENEKCMACDKNQSCQNFIYKSDVSLEQNLHSMSSINTDGGFDDIKFQELVEHIKTCLDSAMERYIFMLLVDPPKELCEMAIMEKNKKVRSLFFRGLLTKDDDGAGSVRPTGQLIIKFLWENGCQITQNEYYACQKRIREKVLEIVKEG